MQNLVLTWGYIAAHIKIIRYRNLNLRFPLHPSPVLCPCPSGVGAISIAKYNALILDGLLMSGNRAQRGAGGALYCLSCSRMAIVNVSFLSNSAVWGGAMAIFSSNGTISGSVFQRNSASDGGALFAAPGSLGIEMSDFVRNVACEGLVLEKNVAYVSPRRGTHLGSMSEAEGLFSC